MTATTPDATADTHPGSRRQLRLALSMNGGVSLAVWIGGSVSEIDRVRRGDPFWSELLTACGYEPTATGSRQSYRRWRAPSVHLPAAA